MAHAEALLRAVEARSATLDEPLDAICIGIPRTTPHLPRERPNPLLAAYLGLGLALRLWRDAFPIVDGGTVILLHRFHRHFAHPTQQPYRAFFQALAHRARETEELGHAERAAASDPRAIAAYRDGPHVPPAAAVRRLGRLRAGARPASARCSSPAAATRSAARQLGFVPTHGVGAALEMARGRRPGRTRASASCSRRRTSRSARRPG